MIYHSTTPSVRYEYLRHQSIKQFSSGIRGKIKNHLAFPHGPRNTQPVRPRQNPPPRRDWAQKKNRLLQPASTISVAPILSIPSTQTPVNQETRPDHLRRECPTLPKNPHFKEPSKSVPSIGDSFSSPNIHSLKHACSSLVLKPALHAIRSGRAS